MTSETRVAVVSLEPSVATVVGFFFPIVAVVVYLGLSLLFFIDSLWIERVRRSVQRAT